MGPHHAPLPETIGRFRVEAVLGRGGMGEVYKAFDPTLQRTVAVKTVRPDMDRPEYLERMMREAQACARLSHPNIVTVFEAGQVDGMVFIAMEYLQGENLAEVLEKKSLSFEDKIRVLAKVLEALHHAHGLDVVHRDIKPSNIHLQSDGTIKLMDFGLARLLQADTLTASGNVLGTPHYASPEQLKGEPVDRRTDIYSTGVMAYEMLSGRRPFEPDNDSISSVIIKVISEAPKPMDTGMSRLLPEIETIVSRAMAKQPADRFQSADEMRQALVNFLDTSRAEIMAIESSAGSTVVQPTPSMITAATATMAGAPAAGSKQWWWIAGGAAAATLVGALLVAAPNRQMESAEPAPPATNTPPPSGSGNREPGIGADAGTGPVASATAPPAPGSRIPDPGLTRPRPADAPAVPARIPGAKELFASANAANVAPGIRFRMLQEEAGGAAVDVDPAKDFHTGDRIRFAFESNVDGYLYVAQQGTSGNWTVLFPNPDINGGRNAVKRFQEHQVPADGWFQLSGNPGQEQIFVFLSREPLKTLPGFDRPVKSFESGSPALVAELAGRIQSRDLVFEKDRAATGKGPQATYVVNKTEVGKAVTASFALTHKP